MADVTGDVLDTPAAGPRALRGGVLRTAGYVVGILLSLIAVPLLIAHLGIAGYGRYVTVVSLTTIVGGLTEGGLNAIALREYTTSTGIDRDRLMRDALGIRLALTTVGAAAAVAFAALAGYGSQLVLGTALAGAGLLLQLVQSLLAVSLQGDFRFGWSSSTDLLRQLVNVLLLVVLVLLGANVALLLAVAIPASAVSLLLTAVLVRGRMPLRPAFAVGKWWPLIHDSIPWAAVSALNVVYFRLAIVMMSVLATAVQTGYFATSFRVVEILIGVPGVAVAAAYPILTRSMRDDRDRFAYATERMFELALVVGGWMVVCLEVGAGFAIHVLAGDHADPAVAVLRIQGIAVVATFVSVACGVPLLTLRRYRDALLANGVALAISVVLTLGLIGPLGARGAAIAALAAEVALAVIVVARLLAAAPETRLQFASVPLVALAALAAVAVGLLLPVHPVVGAFVASFVFFAALRILGRFPPEIRELLDRRVATHFR
ncbi:MAG TPA: oligosaccharide flippase family protein [Solirubrobacteraceae bacterium]|nr:oligosaccharide flippase family protein [Solirubrobacteraceae bacterium]